MERKEQVNEEAVPPTNDSNLSHWLADHLDRTSDDRRRLQELHDELTTYGELETDKAREQHNIACRLYDHVRTCLFENANYRILNLMKITEGPTEIKNIEKGSELDYCLLAAKSLIANLDEIEEDHKNYAPIDDTISQVSKESDTYGIYRQFSSIVQNTERKIESIAETIGEEFPPLIVNEDDASDH